MIGKGDNIMADFSSITRNYDPIHPEPPINPDTPVLEYGETTNYKLLLMLKDSLSSWLRVFNVNMEKIDVLCHNLELRTSIDGEVPPEAIENIIKLNEEVSEIKGALRTLTDEYNMTAEQVTNMTTQIATLMGDTQVLKNNYVNVDGRVTLLESRMSNVDASLAKLTETINTIQNTLAAHGERITSLNGRVTENATSITSLEDRVAALESKEGS